MFLTKYKLEYENVKTGKENEFFLEILLIQQLSITQKNKFSQFSSSLLAASFLRQMVHSKIPCTLLANIFFFGGNLILLLLEHGGFRFQILNMRVIVFLFLFLKAKVDMYDVNLSVLFGFYGCKCMM